MVALSEITKEVIHCNSAAHEVLSNYVSHDLVLLDNKVPNHPITHVFTHVVGKDYHMPTLACFVELTRA